MVDCAVGYVRVSCHDGALGLRLITVQMPGAEACGLRLCLSGLVRLSCPRHCGPLGGAVRRAVGDGGAAVFVCRAIRMTRSG